MSDKSSNHVTAKDLLYVMYDLAKRSVTRKELEQRCRQLEVKIEKLTEKVESLSKDK
ncbi:hypothetical protein [Vibrio sp. 10N.261.46.A3]|uniref:hypothetical protein n=1 Tax=Vibrio sp. 10N.261.46.A3 TaxID=3229658 RepID=UPI00354C8063